jgi:hypothetical protein
MDEWKHAHEIEELNSFFKVIPPPIKQVIATPEIEQQETSATILGLKKSHFFSNIILAILQSYLFSISFKIIKEGIRFEKQTNRI